MSEQIYQQALQEFAPLPLNEKKQKLLDLIESFGNVHPVFWELTKDIQTLKYEDEQYIDIYKVVLKSMYEVEQEWLTVWVQRIEKLHNFLMQLRAKEAEENKNEWDIDLWLDKVLATLQ